MSEPSAWICRVIPYYLLTTKQQRYFKPVQLISGQFQPVAFSGAVVIIKGARKGLFVDAVEMICTSSVPSPLVSRLIFAVFVG